MIMGIYRATEQMKTYKPAEHEATTSVAPLMQFFELVHIGDTIQSIVQAQFDVIVDILRNETAVAILEAIELQPNRQWLYDPLHEEVDKRIMKVEGLSANTAGSMHGFLVGRQYALYQLLRRGNSDCPVGPTFCGKKGPDRCDEYPRSKAR